MLKRYKEKEAYRDGGWWPWDAYLDFKDEASKNFFDMTLDDFEMIDYHPMKPQLKLELGI